MHSVFLVVVMHEKGSRRKEISLNIAFISLKEKFVFIGFNKFLQEKCTKSNKTVTNKTF